MTNKKIQPANPKTTTTETGEDSKTADRKTAFGKVHPRKAAVIKVHPRKSSTIKVHGG